MTLEIDSITKTFAVKSRVFRAESRSLVAVDGVSASVEDGGSLGIVGESGSGKTTLAKIIAGFYRPDAGAVRLAGENLAGVDRRRRAGLVQMVFQDPFASLNPKLILSTQIIESFSEGSRADRERRAARLMADVGLTAEFLHRYPHQLSGGQRQRFAIARALAKSPRVLLADEPVSSLDLSVQAQIINLLNDLRRARGFTLVVISHDLAVIANLSDRVAVMKDGRIVERGTVKNVLLDPKEAYTKRLLAAAPVA